MVSNDARFVRVSPIRNFTRNKVSAKAADVVREGVDAMERGEIVHVTGRVNRLIKLFCWQRSVPDRLALNVVQRRSQQFREV
jgi:hypothetical protein